MKLSWKNLRLSEKFTIGFGTVIVLLVVVAVWAVLGISRIVDNAAEVISGNQLDAMLAQKEVDHLNWVAKLNTLLTDDKVTTLDVETDDHKCAFGHWLYGEERKHVETLVPSLAPLLKEIEAPHYELHHSAINIDKHFQQADLEMGNFLREKKTDHLAWAHRIKDAFVDTSLTIIKAESDPNKCSLGQWMHSPETAALKQEDPQFAALLENLAGPHTKLHQSALTIQKMIDQGRRDEARIFYMNNTKALANECLDRIDHILNWHDEKVQGMQKANGIYASQTIPALQKTQAILNELRKEAKNHIMTDEKMLNAATTTRMIVLMIGIGATAIGVLLAFVIARGIIVPMQKGVNLAKSVADGDLTVAINVDQEDEIGILAKALNGMSSNLKVMMKDMAQGIETLTSSSTELSAISNKMSAGAEQTSGKSNTVATAAEEMSANMNSVAAASEQASTNVQMVASAAEEMTATINEIAQNTEKGRSITGKAVEQAQSVSTKVNQLGKSAKEVDRVTETISEISEQTNLLALNATIEAARAGEAGKGFAVVANEIKELAKQTALATGDISERISGIQGTTAETVAEIEHIVNVINEINDIVSTIATAIEEQSTATTEIAGNITQAAQGIDEVNQNVSQSSTVAGSISQEIVEVSQASQEMSSSSAQVNLSAGDLSKLAERLNEMVSRFKTS